MHDEESGEPTACPHCGAEQECPHLLVVFDLGAGVASGGYAVPHFSTLESIAQRLLSFPAALPLEESGLRVRWRHAPAGALFKEAVARQRAEGLEELAPDRRMLLDLYSEALEAAGAERAPGRPVDEGSSPGCDSALRVYFAEKPLAVWLQTHRALMGLLQNWLVQTPTPRKKKTTLTHGGARTNVGRQKVAKKKAPPKRRRSPKDVSPRR